MWFRPFRQLLFQGVVFFGSAKESSSVSTFKCCVLAIQSMTPEWFLLENVDLDADDVEGNLQHILTILTDLSYKVQVYRLKTSDFGIPQRRIRIFIAGFCENRHPQASFTRMTKTLSAMQMRCQPPEACLTSWVVLSCYTVHLRDSYT